MSGVIALSPGYFVIDLIVIVFVLAATPRELQRRKMGKSNNFTLIVVVLLWEVMCVILDFL